MTDEVVVRNVKLTVEAELAKKRILKQPIPVKS